MNVPSPGLKLQLEKSIINAFVECFGPTCLTESINQHTTDVVGRLKTFRLTPQRLDDLYKTYWAIAKNRRKDLYDKKTPSEIAQKIADRIVKS